MILEIDMTGDIPIYQQIRNQIVFGVVLGHLKVGERLPTVRQLAGDIGVNPMTVSKAYTLLKEEGIIVVDRRHGAKINSSQLQENSLDEQFDQKLMLLFSEARVKGVTREELLKRAADIINNIYEKGEIS